MKVNNSKGIGVVQSASPLLILITMSAFEYGIGSNSEWEDLAWIVGIGALALFVLLAKKM